MSFPAALCLKKSLFVSEHHAKIALFLTFTVSLIATMPLMAEYRQPPNSRIAIDLDAKFIPSPRFSGFINPDSGASYVMIEMPAVAYSELKTMPEHRENLAQRGMTPPHIGKLPGRTDDYVYFTAVQTENKIRYAKFILIFKTKKLTGFVTATVPEAAFDAGMLTRDEIEKTLTTVTIRDEVGAAKKLFELGYLGPFKLAATNSGSSELYNTTGTAPQAGVNILAQEPTLTVTPSLNQGIINSIEESAKTRFRTLSGLYGRKVIREERVVIGGLEGYRIIAETTTEKSSEDRNVTLHFVMLAGKTGGYYILLGTVPDAQTDEIFPELEKVIVSFKPAK